MIVAATTMTPTASMTDVTMSAAKMAMTTVGPAAVAVAMITIMVSIVIVINAHTVTGTAMILETTIAARMDEILGARVSMIWS